MKVTRIVCIPILFGLVGNALHGQDAVLAIGSPVARDIAPGESHDYTVSASVGDLVSGLFTLRGVAGSLEVRDPTNTRIKTFVAYEPQPTQEQPVGFLASKPGTYQIRVKASGTVKGSYVLRIERAEASSRMRGVQAQPREVYASERVRQLAREIRERQADAVDRFWREVTGIAPLVEPLKDSNDDVLVTFLWKEAYDTQNVLLLWPPTTQGRADEYFMSHLDGTDVWYKTIRVRRGSRFSYTLSPNDRPEDRAITSQKDPLNPRRFPEEVDPSDTNVSSVLELPGAPDDTWARRVPTNRGVVQQKQLKSASLKGARDILVYTPPGYSPNTGAYPLVILFDGLAYIDDTWGVRALNTLDNLVSDKRIRPPVVCFVDTSQTRSTDLGGFGDAFGQAIARELLPMLRSSYAISKSPRDVVIGGFSSGGKTAALIALKHPDVFGNVLSQSGGFNSNTSGSSEPNALARMALTERRVPVRFYLEYGLYERMANADRPLDQLVIDEGLTVANRHFRDVLLAKGYDVTYRETGTPHGNLHWRATLADGLMTLLKPMR